MAEQWKIEDSQYGYTLHDPTGRVVGVLHDGEVAITALRALNHEALTQQQPRTSDGGGDALRAGDAERLRIAEEALGLIARCGCSACGPAPPTGPRGVRARGGSVWGGTARNCWRPRRSGNFARTATSGCRGQRGARRTER